LSITAELVARRASVLRRARTVLDGFFATAVLLGWAAALARVVLAGLFVASMWLGGRRWPETPTRRLADELAPRGPWLLGLLALSSCVEVLAPARWFTGIAASGLLIIAGVLGAAAQASASGAALVACALVHRGLPAELAIPFLALGSLPIRRTPLVRALLGALVAIAAALAAALLLTRIGFLRGAGQAASSVFARARDPVVAQAASAPLSAACVVIVVVIAVALAFRSGVRGWFAPLRHADPHEHPAHGHAPAGVP
ncbi:MAG TPA: hypothetical protein VG496_18940, partial [Myxococcales bacterium]|nr:hypothetical protein [Myxococcales bacterium]